MLSARSRYGISCRIASQSSTSNAGTAERTVLTAGRVRELLAATGEPGSGLELAAGEAVDELASGRVGAEGAEPAFHDLLDGGVRWRVLSVVAGGHESGPPARDWPIKPD